MTFKQFTTKEQQVEFNQLFRDCSIYRFTNEETQAYIKNKTGIEISLDSISKTRKNFKDNDIKTKLVSL